MSQAIEATSVPPRADAQDTSTESRCGPEGSAQVYRRLVEAILPEEGVSPALYEALLDVGYDPKAVGSNAVSLDLFHAVIDVVGHALLPLGGHRERQRLMGRRMVRGFAQQPAGRVYYGGLRSVGPERAMSRLPVSLRFGAEGMRVQVEPLGLRRWRVNLFETSRGTGEFFCGTLLEMLAQVGVPEARAHIEHHTDSTTSVLVSWEDLGPLPFVDPGAD